MSKIRNIVPGDFYRHFKDKLYQIKGIAYHSETKEKMVVYQALYGDFSLYVRPYDMFADEVDHEKYPQVKQRYRFERVEIIYEENKTADFVVTSVNGAESNNYDNLSLQKEEIPYNNTDDCVNTAGDLQEMPDSRLIMFLDAESYQEKLNVLALLKSNMDDRLVNDMAVSLDIEVPEGPIEQRYDSLKNCILTHAKYEGYRLR